MDNFKKGIQKKRPKSSVLTQSYQVNPNANYLLDKKNNDIFDMSPSRNGNTNNGLFLESAEHQKNAFIENFNKYVSLSSCHSMWIHQKIQREAAEKEKKQQDAQIQYKLDVDKNEDINGIETPESSFASTPNTTFFRNKKD